MPRSPYQTAAKQKRLTYRKSRRRLPGASPGAGRELRAGLRVPARGAAVGPRYGRASPAKPPPTCGSGFSSQAGSPALPQGRVAGALFPASGSAGDRQPVKEFISGKGATRRGWGWWAASVTARGQREMSRIISLSSPNPTTPQPMSGMLYRIH